MMPKSSDGRGETQENEVASTKNLSSSSQQRKKWKRIIREVAAESSGDKEEDYPSMKRKHDVVAMMEIEEVENVAKREILT